MCKVENYQEQERWQEASGLSRQFIQRLDIHARQLPDGRYICVARPFGTSLMYQHLKGEITLGTYLLDQDSHARFTVIDADTATQFDQLKQLSVELSGQGSPTYLEASRRGGHLWLFFEKSVPGSQARGLGLGLLQAYDLVGMEVYPKQDQLISGPGSLIRVPFGVHKKTRERYPFINPDGAPLGSTRQQVEWLSAPQTVPLSTLEQYQYHPPEKLIKTPFAHPEVENFKDIPLVDFVSQYVDLRPVASGAVGHCPFHEDDVPSFGVNAKGNYWYCFAGCGGGDIISFWMRYRNLGFKQAVEELKEMIGHGANSHRS